MAGLGIYLLDQITNSGRSPTWADIREIANALSVAPPSGGVGALAWSGNIVSIPAPFGPTNVTSHGAFNVLIERAPSLVNIGVTEVADFLIGGELKAAVRTQARLS